MDRPDPPSRYDSCPEICGRLEHPGLATDMPIWIDHTRENTTIDQAGIEDALDGKADFVHTDMGIDNHESLRANVRFCRARGRIDGAIFRRSVPYCAQ